MEAQADSVTVSMPYLLQLIKKCYPGLKVNISVGAGISSLAKARYWEDLGADQLTLLPTEANRDFTLLRNMRRALKCRLQLIANLPCLHECPFYAYHIASLGHASQKKHGRKGFFIDYYPLLCKIHKLSEPWRMIAAGWIRPEDLPYYEEAGIDSIKLVDRGWKSEHILRAAEAYGRGRHQGNLLELFSDPTKYQSYSGRFFWKNLGHYFRPLKYNIPLFSGRLNSLVLKDPSLLDNGELEGFIKFFIEGRCKSGACDECGYCRAIAKKAFHVPPEYREKMLASCGALLDDIIDGSLFYARKNNRHKGEAEDEN
jgi:hypothetical protein